MALAIVQHSNAIHTTQNPPSAVTLSSAPTAGNLIIALMGVNMNSYTVNTTGWTQFDGTQLADAILPTSSSMIALYRYAQIGDTATLPAFLTAGSTYWSHQIWEISGVTGTWDTDFLCSFGLPTTESNAAICPLRVFANSLALTGCASYNGNTNPTISGSWTRDDANNNNANFGSAAGAHRAMVANDVLDGAWTQGTSSPYSAIVLILTTAQPTNGVYPRHTLRCGGSTGFTGTVALPWAPKIGNLLLAYVPYGHSTDGSPTVSSNWTEYSSSTNGTGKRILSLYRYAQSGDKTLPALFTAAGAFMEFMLVELGGSVSGTFGTDHVSNKTATQASGATQTTTADTTTANGQFAILAYGNYNASADPTATSFDGYLIKSNIAVSYGGFLLMFKYLATSGTTVQSVITPGLTSTEQSYSQDIFNFGAGASTETGTATMALSGISFSAAAARSEAGTGGLALTKISYTVSGARKETGTGGLVLSKISYTAAGKRGPAAHATMALSGVSIVALGINAGTAGHGVRQMWTY